MVSGAGLGSHVCQHILTIPTTSVTLGHLYSPQSFPVKSNFATNMVVHKFFTILHVFQEQLMEVEFLAIFKALDGYRS